MPSSSFVPVFFPLNENITPDANTASAINEMVRSMIFLFRLFEILFKTKTFSIKLS
jgi:hypothetical protein